ncbi:MAG: hypothetical protein H3C47_01525 [Candidatus Cloacimonetes bacterium]|nr:hypothetical protein [Candidatus Cloacimonadota bacterium]
MAYFVPIEIDKRENGFTGRFSFDPSFSCTADTRDALVKKLFVAINSFVQKQKPLEFLSYLEHHLKENGIKSHQLRIELLSVNERMILLGLLALKSIVFYLLFVAAILFLFPSLLTSDTGSGMSMDLIPQFRAQALLVEYCIVSGFVLWFLLFLRFGYPVILRAYEGAIVSSKSLMRIHMLFIGRPANLFLSQSYVFRGSTS